jgi:hypothetical protein
MWTRFMDMHSGGGLKESFGYAYIEAPEEEAKAIFYHRFGHNPERVSCTCCGQDYSIGESPTLEEATAHERRCRWAEDPRGWSASKEPDYKKGRYLEPGEPVPDGMVVKDAYQRGEGVTLEEWKRAGKGNIDGGVLFIYAHEIKPEERVGEVPEQGYVWAG